MTKAARPRVARAGYVWRGQVTRAEERLPRSHGNAPLLPRSQRPGESG